MGIQCRIIRDSSGGITYVEAPNGNRSQLFEDAKAMLGEEAALNVVLTAYTPTFIEEVKNPKMMAFRREILNKINSIPSSANVLSIQIGNTNESIDPSTIQMVTEDLGNGETLVTFKADLSSLDTKPLLAPNGQSSNLNHQQWNQVRSPEFMEWSNGWADVLKDENGEPQVHYHGTVNHGFTKFDSGKGIEFFTPNYKIAEAYAGFEVIDPKSIYSVFIKSEKTFDPVQEIPSEVHDFIEKNWKQIGKETPTIARTKKNEVLEKIYDILQNKEYNWEILELPIFLDFLKSKGYTALKTLEQGGNIGVFTAPQIKSATDNVGTFDNTNPDIRFSVGNTDVGFDRWKGKNKLVSGAAVQKVKTGEPVVIRGYHGTTNEFYEFDSSVKGTIEGHLGRINYFTTDIDDATNNYLADGADLTSRIERETTYLEDYLREEYNDFEESEDFDRFVEDNNVTEAELKERNLTRDSVDPAAYLADILATRKLVGGTERVLDLYIKLNNPVVLGRGLEYHDLTDKSQYEEFIDEAAAEIAEENEVSLAEAKEDYFYEVESRAMEKAGYVNPIYQALADAIENNSYDYSNAASKAAEVLEGYLDSEVNLNQLEKRIREELAFEENENGEMSSAQIVSDFFKNLGYDGIILNDVSNRFNMGLKDTTSHVHVFDEYNRNIKLADGSNVTFGDTADIRFSMDNSRIEDTDNYEILEYDSEYEVYTLESPIGEMEIYAEENTPKSEIIEMAIQSVKDTIEDLRIAEQPIVYRGIQGEFSDTFEGIQYFAEQRGYAGVWGKNVEEFRIDNREVLDLDDWNRKWGLEFEDYGQGYLTVHSDNFNRPDEYAFYIENRLQRLGRGDEWAQAETEAFMKEFQEAKIVRGEDIGNRGQKVYAVRDKSLVKPVNASLKFAQGKQVNTPTEKLQGLVDTLFPSDLAKKVSILSEAEFAKRVGEAGGRYQQNMNGFALKNEVVLNERMAGMDTPIHEFGHLWNSYMKENAKDIYYRGLSLIEKEGQKYLDFVDKNQPKLKGEARLEEALAQAIGDNGKILASNEAKGLKEWLKSLWEAIKDIAGFSDVTPEQLRKMTLKDFTTRAAADLMRGESISDLMATSPYVTGEAYQPIDEPSFTPTKPSNRFNYNVDFVTPLESRSLEDIFKEYEGRVFIVTSDATGTGYDSKGDPIYGGIGYMSIKENVDGNIGFASLDEVTVKQTLGKIHTRYGANQKVAVLVMVQNADATVGNFYGAKYFGRGLKLIKEQNPSDYDAMVDSIQEYIKTHKGVNEQFKAKYNKKGELKRAATFKAFMDLMRNVDKYSELEFAEEFIKDTTFDARRTLLQSLLIKTDETRTDSSTPLVKTRLKELGFNQIDFLKEYGDNTLFTEEMYRNNEGGLLVGGFEYQTESKVKSDKTISEAQKKGLNHHQFNGKLPSTGKRWFLDGIYPANENLMSYAEKNNTINYKNISKEEVAKIVTDTYTKDTDYIPAVREGAEGYIPMAERTYTNLRTENKSKLKESLFQLDPDNLLEKDPNVAVNVARGLGFTPFKESERFALSAKNDTIRFSVGETLTPAKFSSMLMRGQWGMLTAENPNAKELSAEENAKRNEEGKAWLEARGYELIPITGYYGSKENSFFVPNLTPQDAIDFAVKFDQESVATDIGLIYADGTMEHRVKRNDKQGGTFEDYYSTINFNGRDFNFSIGYAIGNAQKNDSLLVKTKAEIDAVQEDKGHIPHLTRDGEGNYVFYHYSTQVRDEVDPKKSGSNPNDITASGEAAAIARVGGVSMYYTKTKDKETGVGDNGHLMKIPMEKVYDVNKDPDGLLELARKDFEKRYPNSAFDGNNQVAFMTKIANQKGYDMVVAEWKAGAYRAQTTKTLKPNEVRIVEKNVLKQDWTNYESGKRKSNVGFIQTKKTPQGEQVKLSNVDPKVQGKGVGTEMYKKLATDLASKGTSLVSDQNNKGAEGIWNKFQEADIVEPVDIDGVVVDRVRLAPDSFDVNGEPSLGDVVKYIQAKNYEGQELTQEETNEVRNTMLGTQFKDSQELFKALQRAFTPDGVYNPSETSMMASGLYSKVEARHILDSTERQLRAYEMMQKIKNSDTILNKSDIDSDYITLTSRHNSLGILEKTNPFINKKNAVQLLGGIQIQSEFTNQMESNGLEFARDKFNELSQMTRLNVSKVTGNSISNYTTLDKLREKLEETLTSVSNTDLVKNLNYALEIPNDVWNLEFRNIRPLLDEIEASSVDLGLDMSQLTENAYDKTPTEVKSMLNSIRNFAVMQNEATFDILMNEYVRFFDIQDKPIIKVISAPRNKTLVYADTQTSSLELFNGVGLLPLGKNLYQKVNTNKSLDEVVHIIYKTLPNRNDLIPAEALTSVYNGEVIDYSKLEDPNYESFVKEDIINYANKESKKIDNSKNADTDTVRKMVLFSKFFNTRLDNSKEVPSLAGEVTFMEKYPSNANYLATDFISDFNKQMIKERVKNSEKYNNFYKHFDISTKGIELLNDDIITRQEIAPYLTEDLKNHFRMKKESLELDAVNDAANDVASDVVMRNYYSNYPQALPKFTGVYQVDKNRVLTNNSAEKFIRVDEGVFEFIETIGNKAIYGHLPTNISEFKVYNNNMAEPELGDISKFNMTTGVKANKNINNLYSKSKDSQITNEIDNC